MNPRTYGFGIIGCGVIAPLHAQAVIALPNARLVAVADLVPERARERAAEFGVDHHVEIGELLARSDVDVVSVCVPSGLHAEVGIQAAAAGKHVVVEKPVEVTLEAVDRLIAACQANRVELAVISQHRWDPGVHALKSWWIPVGWDDSFSGMRL